MWSCRVWPAEGRFGKRPETLMPTVIRFNKRRYLASGIDLTELFDQIPEPIAYFDADNQLGACNLSFRNNFPVVIESDFLRRASHGPISSHPQPAHLQSTELTGPHATSVPAIRGDFEPQIRKTPDGGTLLTFRD